MRNNLERFKSFKLNESPDHPLMVTRGPAKYRDKSYMNNDAITFGYIELYKLDMYELMSELNQLYKSEKSNKYELEKSYLNNDIKAKKKNFGWLTDVNLFNLPKNKNEKIMSLAKKSTHYSIGVNGVNRDTFDFAGRLWFDSKLITFWELPKTNEELITVIKDIEKSYKIFYGKDIDILGDDEWFVEATTKPSGEYRSEEYLVKVKDYLGGSKRSKEELEAPHLLKPEEKKKYMEERGYKGKVSKWKKHMKPFESKKHIKINNNKNIIHKTSFF